MAKKRKIVVCDFSMARDKEPRLLLPGVGSMKKQWLVKLYVKNDTITEEGKQNGITDNLRTTNACYLSQMLELILKRKDEMMDQAMEELGGYTDAGFEVIKMS